MFYLSLYLQGQREAVFIRLVLLFPTRDFETTRACASSNYNSPLPSTFPALHQAPTLMQISENIFPRLFHPDLVRLPASFCEE